MNLFKNNPFKNKIPDKYLLPVRYNTIISEFAIMMIAYTVSGGRGRVHALPTMIYDNIRDDDNNHITIPKKYTLIGCENIRQCEN